MMDTPKWRQQQSAPATGSDGHLKAMRAIELPESTEANQPPASQEWHGQEQLTAEIAPIPEKRKPSSFWLSLHDDSKASDCRETSAGFRHALIVWQGSGEQYSKAGCLWNSIRPFFSRFCHSRARGLLSGANGPITTTGEMSVADRSPRTSPN